MPAYHSYSFRRHTDIYGMEILILKRYCYEYAPFVGLDSMQINSRIRNFRNFSARIPEANIRAIYINITFRVEFPVPGMPIAKCSTSITASNTQPNVVQFYQWPSQHIIHRTSTISPLGSTKQYAQCMHGMLHILM